MDPDDLPAVDCEIWIPAARPDVLTAANAPGVRARVILEGANIPSTPEAEAIFQDRGILVVPDFIANAGGVICASVEYRGGTRSQAFALIEEKIRSNTATVIDSSSSTGTTPRVAAERLARERLAEAASYRRRS